MSDVYSLLCQMSPVACKQQPYDRDSTKALEAFALPTAPVTVILQPSCQDTVTATCHQEDRG